MDILMDTFIGLTWFVVAGFKNCRFRAKLNGINLKRDPGQGCRGEGGGPEREIGGRGPESNSSQPDL